MINKFKVGDRVIINTAWASKENWGDRGVIEQLPDRNGWYNVKMDRPPINGPEKFLLADYELDLEEPLKLGDRVWCFPHQQCGFEAEIILMRGPIEKRPGVSVAIDGGVANCLVAGPGFPTARSVPLTSMVKFDENHNQKRAYRRGSEIQFRVRDSEDSYWSCISQPAWLPEYEYRVAPHVAPVPKAKKIRQPKDDQWTEWAGCPVPPVAPTTRVDVILRCYQFLSGFEANDFEWDHSRDPVEAQVDIVKYRICKTPKKSVFTTPMPLPRCGDVWADFAPPPKGEYPIPVFLDGGAKKFVDANPKGAFGRKKISHSCVPQNVSALVAVGMSEGAHKYDRHNFRSIDILASDYYDATRRHLDAYWEGQDDDPDSKLHHVIKAICSLYVLADGIDRGNVIDDRPPASRVGWIEEANADAARLYDQYKGAA